MDPKRSKVPHASSSSSNISGRFVNDKARARYEHAKINWGTIKEREFAFVVGNSSILY